ncbi:hypothetical protein TWF569_005730 [Orbilia oligospora]|uniref:Transcription factor BYE1 n=1 Tax=Orbilia oligospora TaxID=2813651 RepID=A0A7C8N8I5_ORBOL|nr:hypothetical protein TWF706_011845 [Orbilia oligospora]KAF3087810.1 hypothetical protein TWF103_001310 [Orbilia oligospora]KAF3090343.1 hypothetical protein TWF102_009307 [Orbilia oligospora]KAF3125476.1 hypothetical protein TWF594_001583 [Orbilia oligospora]KAF3148386.1 hypothetical protein TWF569_005730 [Orbilia oligospora]
MPGDESGTPEPRRSGRSTKGQHTRNAELNEEIPAKKPVTAPSTPAPKKNEKKTTRSSKSKSDKTDATSPAADADADADADANANADADADTPGGNEEDGEVIRCVCGADTDEGGRQMISCDQCEVWQHSSCMQIPTKKTPDHYYCEQCKPELHKDLLEKMARGEKPWERRNRKGARKSVGGSKKKKESEAPETPAPEEIQDDEKDDDAKMDSPAPTMTTEAEKDTEEPTHDTVVNNLEEVLDASNKDKEEEQQGDVAMEEVTENESPEKSVPPESTPAPTESGRRLSSVASPTTLKRKADESVEEGTPDGKASSPARRGSIPQSPTQTKSSKTRSGRRSSTTTSKPPPKKPKMADNQLEQVVEIDDLKSETRRKGAETLKKFLEGALRPVEKLPEGETSKSEFAARLALEIEHHTYILLSAQTAGEPNDEYRQKFRSILFNLKKNEPLLNNVLTGKLGTKEFSDMTGDEMATEDMKHIVQEAEKESEKQSIMTAEATGPRIRRTHKGEEVVGEDTGMIAENSSGFIGSRYEPPAEKSDDEHSAPPSPGAEDHEMTDRPRSPSPTALQEPADTPSKPLKIDTSKQASGSAHHRRTSSFDIQNVWSNVESTDAGHRQSIPRPPITPLTAHPANGNNAQLDRDIDMLLRNDDSPGAGSETPPYSPKDYMDESEEGVVWKGKVLMRGVADLEAQATHVAGPDLSTKVPWATVIGNSIEITGRISVDRANEYLQQLKYSSRSSDVVVFTIHASASRSSSSDAETGFTKLFSHFKERQRSGVVGNITWSPTKDVYVVAVGKDESMPKYMLNTQFPAHPREKDNLLLCIVFNRTLEPFQDNHTPTTATAAYTPAPPSRALHTPVTIAPGTGQQGWQPPTQLNNIYSAYQQSPTPVGYQASPPLATGISTQAISLQYSPPGLQHGSPITLPVAGSSVSNGAPQQNPNVVEQLMKLLHLGPADQAMLRDIVDKNPESVGNPEQLMQLVAQYQHQRRA